MRGISFIFETQESEKGSMAPKHSFNFFHKKLGPGALSIAFILGGASVALYDDLKPLPPVIQDTHGIHIQACFTPGQRCQGLILGQIHQATRSISVMAYYLTAQQLFKTPIDANNLFPSRQATFMMS